MKKEKMMHELMVVFWVFIIGSILGYIYETILVILQKGYFESRQGLIYGPFIPVYGIGGIVYYLVLKKVKTKNKIKVFFITMILGGVTEYLCSFVQEKLFGTISWDYSYLPFNFNGRTSLLHCTYWGIAGVLYISYIGPMIEKLRGIDRDKMKFVTIILVMFITFDITISCVAADRQKERRNDILPKNQVDIFLDKYYSDEYLDKIYTNLKELD